MFTNGYVVSESAKFSRREIEVSGYVAHELARIYPSLTVLPRSSFKIASALVSPTKYRTKKTTVRYVADAVEYPTTPALPMFVKTKRGDEYASVGVAQIVALTYKPFRALDLADALHDGFENADALMQQLRGFYGPIQGDETVCIFSFAFEPSPVSRGSPLQAIGRSILGYEPEGSFPTQR